MRPDSSSVHLTSYAAKQYLPRDYGPDGDAEGLCCEYTAARRRLDHATFRERARLAVAFTARVQPPCAAGCDGSRCRRRAACSGPPHHRNGPAGTTGANGAKAGGMSSWSGLLAAWLGAGHGGHGGAPNRTRPSGPACCAQKSVRVRAEELEEARRGQVVVSARLAQPSAAHERAERPAVALTHEACKGQRAAGGRAGMRLHVSCARVGGMSM